MEKILFFLGAVAFAASQVLMGYLYSLNMIPLILLVPADLGLWVALVASLVAFNKYWEFSKGSPSERLTMFAVELIFFLVLPLIALGYGMTLT